MRLTELQLDVLGELCNMGLGAAASSLSGMVGAEVELSIPHVEIVSIAEVASKLGIDEERTLKGVCQHFGGTLGGDALLLFPDQDSLNLVRLMLAHSGIAESESLNELEEEALLEVGNVILNAILSVLADAFEIELNMGLPSRLEGTGIGVLKKAGAGDAGPIDGQVLVVGIDFSVQGNPVTGYVSLVFEVGAADELTRQVDHYIREKLGTHA